MRIISSSAYNLESLIAEGRFREDLFHRLAVVPVKVPALAERREDIPELVENFIERICEASGMPRRVLSEDAIGALQVRPWPGNLRQLRNVVERMLILSSGDPREPITADMVPSDAPPAEGGGLLGADKIIALPLREARETFEREYLSAQMMRFSGNISRTAAFIGMERSALHRKLKSLGLSGARAVEEGVD